MRNRIFCCTGSRDSHTCVANNTNHSRNICGKFKNRRGRQSFSFQRRAEIKRSILARTRLKHAFFSQNSTHSPTVWKLRYQKRAKASEEIWSTLADSDSAIFVCFLTVAILACVSGKRTSYLLVSFFFHRSPMKIRPGQAEKNEKASSVYRLRQSTIAEKMKRCVPLRRNVAEKARGMRLKFVLSQLEPLPQGFSLKKC